MKSNQLEIVITKLKTRYKATCALFPDCKGVGSSEEKALTDLSVSISKCIASLTQKSLDSLFSSHHFDKILLDGTSQKRKQTRYFQLDPAFTHINNHFVLKYKTDIQPPALPKLPDNDIVQFFDDMENAVLDHFSKDEAAGGVETLPDGGMVFGFPLNMN
jgi:predicted RNase H-like HicB family nuclease